MRYVLSAMLLFVFAGCGSSSFKSEALNTNNSTGELVTETPYTPNPAHAEPLQVVLKYKGDSWSQLSYEDYGIPEYTFNQRPSWESGAPSAWQEQAASYSQYAAFILDHFANNMIDGTHALNAQNSVCPKYNQFSRDQRIEFWVHFVSAVTKFESGYKPNMRYFESTFGYKDSVTKEAVYSEGLLQLSYQDVKSYKECAPAFLWNQDKVLSRTSLSKTIFDPMRNLYCGISIMNRIIKSKKTLFFDTNHYWAVLKPGGKYGKVNEIKTILKQKNPNCF